jgi:hypothetical protein
MVELWAVDNRDPPRIMRGPVSASLAERVKRPLVTSLTDHLSAFKPKRIPPETLIAGR